MTPLVLTLLCLGGAVYLSGRRDGGSGDGAQRLLAAAVRRMPEGRQDWGNAMRAELTQITSPITRWRFALGCLRTALFPPTDRSMFFSWWDGFRRLGFGCGLLSVIVPTLSLPFLCISAALAENFIVHDDFFSSGELVPTLVGICIVGSLACMAAGLPLGLAGLIRREQHRWLCGVGPFSSVAIFTYLQVVQHLAMKQMQ